MKKSSILKLVCILTGSLLLSGCIVGVASILSNRNDADNRSLKVIDKNITKGQNGEDRLPNKVTISSTGDERLEELFKRAEQAFNRGDYAQAKDCYDKLLKANPEAVEEPYVFSNIGGTGSGQRKAVQIFGILFSPIGVLITPQNPFAITTMFSGKEKGTEGSLSHGLLINEPHYLFKQIAICQLISGDVEGVTKTINSAQSFINKILQNTAKQIDEIVIFEAYLYQIELQAIRVKLSKITGEYASATAELRIMSQTLGKLGTNSEGKTFLRARLNNLLADILVELGKFDAANTLYSNSLVLFEKVNNDIYQLPFTTAVGTGASLSIALPVTEDRIDALVGLAEVSIRTGRFQSAITNLNNALNLLSKSSEDNTINTSPGFRLGARIHLAKARLYLALRQWESCSKELDNLQKKAGNNFNGRMLVETALLQAKLHLSQNNREKALRSAELALKNAKSLNDRIFIYQALMTHAESIRMARPGKAIEDLESAVSIANLLGVRSIADIYLNIADIRLSQGEISEAEVALEKVNTLLKDYQDPEKQFAYYQLRARQAAIRNDGKNAIVLLRRAVGLIEGMRTQISVDTYKTSYFANKILAYQELVDLLISQGAVEEAFSFLEKTKGRTLLDLLAQSDVYARKNADPLFKQIQEQEKKLAGAMKRLDRVALVSDSSRSLSAKSDNETNELLREYRSLQIKLKEQDRAFMTLVAGETVSLQSLKDELGTNTLLVEYYLRDNRLGAFLLTGSDIKFITIAEGKENVAKCLDLIRKVSSEDNPSEKMISELSQYLISPIVSHIGKFSGICFVPTGILNRLSFSLLQYQGQPLVNTKQVVINPSATMFQIAQQRKKTFTDNTMIVSNPMFDDKDLALPGAEKEGKIVNGIMGKSVLLEKQGATESALKSRKGMFSIYHFATHGVYNQDNPMFSYLLLRQGEGEDGLLFANEIFEQDFNSDLIVLSACESGIVKVEEGDEIMGLNRAFLFAGAKTILSALWKIDDAVTVLFMEKFYQSLQKTGNKGKSFQDAMNAVRMSNPNPKFWAAFQLVGALN